MKKTFVSLFSLIVINHMQAQNVGIGTTSPLAKLHVAESSVLFSSTGGIPASPGNPPIAGSGRRLMWYADKAAFRVGQLFLDGAGFWDKNMIGDASVAAGYNVIASGDYSVALGYRSNASGYGSLAAAGTSYASGVFSVALGSAATASGDYSVAIGTGINTNNKIGSFFLADSDPHAKPIRIIGFDNQMVMRFNGGYWLISDDAGADIGVRVVAGDNAWSPMSDVRLKENFLPVDGEEVLKKISTFNSVTWNYKGQDAKTFRHYGPMAQDFFAAFGKDELGTIGCDTLINQQDFLGVNLIAIQALEKRTTQLQKENEELKARLMRLEKMVATLKGE